MGLSIPFAMEISSISPLAYALDCVTTSVTKFFATVDFSLISSFTLDSTPRSNLSGVCITCKTELIAPIIGLSIPFAMEISSISPLAYALDCVTTSVTKFFATVDFSLISSFTLDSTPRSNLSGVCITCKTELMVPVIGLSVPFAMEISSISPLAYALDCLTTSGIKFFANVNVFDIIFPIFSPDVHINLGIPHAFCITFPIKFMIGFAELSSGTSNSIASLSPFIYDNALEPTLVPNPMINRPAFVLISFSLTESSAFFAIFLTLLTPSFIPFHALLALSLTDATIAPGPFFMVLIPLFIPFHTFADPLLIPFHVFDVILAIARPALLINPSCFLSFQSA